MTPEPVQDPEQSLDLSRRAARLERDAWVDLVRSAAAPALAATNLTVCELGGAMAVRCPAGGPLMNRAYGAPADPAVLRALAAHYTSAHVPLFFIDLDEPDRGRCEDAAAEAGLVRYRRRLIVLIRSAGPVAPVATPFDVGIASRAELVHAARIYCAAFDAAAALAPVIASVSGSPRWRFVVARERGVPIGIGILHVDGELGYLFGAATSPSFRGMGVQRALIAARLEIAEELGVRAVVTATGEPAPRDPQHSHRNLVRAGFRDVGRIVSYAPPGIVWTHGRRAVSTP